VSEIWAACSTRAAPAVLQGEVHRLVESQEQVATRSLVRTLAEQALLEDLLESSKPALPATAVGLHYLLATPFRYPPLPWGSRFGRRFEPSLFYGARSVDTVLAECAYYRFVFWSGMATPPSAPLDTRHTLFRAGVSTTCGLQLQLAPFDAWQEQLTHPADYSATQALGSELRAAGIEAFEYRSARDPDRGINVALFTPRVFATAKPAVLDEWLCTTGATHVSYYSRHGGGIREFRRDMFTVNGNLPIPPQ
jgi:RES domain